MPAEPSDESPGAGPYREAVALARGKLPDGLLVSWSQSVALEDLLAAARRQLRQQAGQDVPAWGEPEAQQPDRRDSNDPQNLRARHDPEAVDVRDPRGLPKPHDPCGADEDLSAKEFSAKEFCAEEFCTGDFNAEDPYGDDELLAAELAASGPASPGTPGSDSARARVGALPSGASPNGALPVEALAGHARLTPGPVLAGWLSGASPAELDDVALVSSITGWRKVTSWAQAQELAAVAELSRRRGVTGELAPDRTPVEELAADFAPNEVALALTLTQCAADCWMSLAVSLAGRLPATLAALRSGSIDLARARLIDQFTTPLDDELARKVERRVLAKAEHQTTGQLRASLQRAVISADPEAAERRRKQAERNARVELTGEPEGTASLFGRYLPAAQAAAAWARVSAIAKALEQGGAAGGIDLLRAQVFIRLLLGAPLAPPGDHPEPTDDSPSGPSDPGLSDPGLSDTDPSDPGPSDPGPSDTDPSDPGPSDPGPSDPGPSDEGFSDQAQTDPSGPSDPHSPSAQDSPDGPLDPAGRFGGARSSWPGIPSLGEFPGLDLKALGDQAVSQLLRGRPKLSVPWRTLAGLSGQPGQLGRIGPVAAAVARDLAEAAVADPSCEWRIIVVGARGQPLAVTRIRSPGRPRPSSATPADALDSPDPGPLSQVIVTVPSGWRSGPDASRSTSGLPPALLRILAAAAACDPGDSPGDPGDNPSAGDACSHARSVPGYRVPPRLRTFLEARDQDCGYPTCRRAAASCDMDHTTPYHLGGLTCECNLGPYCRRHHRLKGTGAWRLEQPRPGVFRWTTPAGLTYSVSPEPLAA